jgi:3-methylcrotonyl-CoA carboxylase alpha subunit
MFEKVLIANRGEIACRITATLRALGIRAVAVYSEADRDALHVRVADEAHPIGSAEPRASYLNGEALITAARKSGAEAIHPGYGFLAENAEFAAAVEAAGLVFIGPMPEHIRTLGDKRAARAVAAQHGVPVVPGAEGGDVDALAAAARRMGYPVVLKAALGGGGKGMQVLDSEPALREGFESARRVALSGFGDAALYLEKRLERPRHVEVQIAGDGRGQAIHLFERECSLQRRHQKVIEECPSPSIDARVRERLTRAALELATALRYRGVGTVEFLLDPQGAFYFLEVNTRLQVEHPVTELATGVDLVRLQLEIAASGRLPLEGGAVALSGHAIEARVYAEDAAKGFLPQAGEAARVRWPREPFVRVDAGIESGDGVPVHYDPILAKIVAHGSTRAEALARLTLALDDALVHGVITNLPFLRALCRSPEMITARFDTEWIEREFVAGFAAVASAPAPELALAAAALAEAHGPRANGPSRRDEREPAEPFRTTGAWRLPGLA